MFGRKLLMAAVGSTLLLTLMTAADKRLQKAAPEARGIFENNALTGVLPRYIRWLRAGGFTSDNSGQQQQQKQEQQHLPYNYWPPYYSQTLPTPPPPLSPALYHYQRQYFDGHAPYGNSGVPAIIIVIPSISNGTDIGRSGGGRSSFYDYDLNSWQLPELLLRNEYLNDPEENSNESTGKSLADKSEQTQEHVNDEEYIVDDLFAGWQQQAARGLTPKRLLAYLMQNKRRKRVQEAMAGIYLRNAYQHKK